MADRLRKLNERIIEAGKGAGEITLTSYETALKSIASTLERGPGSSDIEWIRISPLHRRSSSATSRRLGHPRPGTC